METLTGVIRGNSIHLAGKPGLPDGQTVEVTMRPIAAEPAGKLPPGEGIRRSAGACAEEAEELDEFLEWNRRQRKIGRREIEE